MTIFNHYAYIGIEQIFARCFLQNMHAFKYRIVLLAKYHAFAMESDFYRYYSFGRIIPVCIIRFFKSNFISPFLIFQCISRILK